MIYVLAYPEFDEQTAHAIDNFRATHEAERAQLVPPHVTLVFGVQDADPNEFTEFCEQSVNDEQRFAVSFDEHEISYDPFEKTHKMLLLCSQGRENLIALHRKLYDGPHFSQFDPKHPYNPHMTVGSNKDRAALTHVSSIEFDTTRTEGWINAIDVVDVNSGRLHSLRSIPFLR